jgi:hypothetical protein
MNPYHPAIAANILKGSHYWEYSFLVAEVFKIEFSTLFHTIISQKIFGKVKAYMWRLEYQKRGLPHIHLLLWTDINVADPEVVDKYFTAELPRMEIYQDRKKEINVIRELALKYQVHHCTRRCTGTKKPGCCYNFPKKIGPETTTTGHWMQLRRREKEDAWIVPYNPIVLYYWRGHSNFEVVSVDGVVGYLFKCAFKHTDSDVINLGKFIMRGGVSVNPKNKLRSFSANLILSAPECISGMFEEKKYRMVSPVIELPIHLKDKKTLLYTGQ